MGYSVATSMADGLLGAAGLLRYDMLLAGSVRPLAFVVMWRSLTPRSLRLVHMPRTGA